MSGLRSSLLRLAHTNSAVRRDLVPMLRAAQVETDEKLTRADLRLHESTSAGCLSRQLDACRSRF